MEMKRSASEIALEEFVRNMSVNGTTTTTTTTATAATTIDSHLSSCVSLDDQLSSLHPNFNFNRTMEADDNYGSFGGLIENSYSILCQCLNADNSNSNNSSSRQANIAAPTPTDSQSSIFGSTVTDNQPKCGNMQVRGGSCESSPEQSDEDDAETETGPYEESADPVALRRIRRKVSNRESARRSRKRKQAHLAGLEMQVKELRGENATLFKQLSDAILQYRHADTNNRVLNSDVEALRAKVKLAEDMVARGSYTCGINHLLLQSLNPQRRVGTRNFGRAANVSPTMTVRGSTDVSYEGIMVPAQNSCIANGNTNGSNNNHHHHTNGII